MSASQNQPDQPFPAQLTPTATPALVRRMAAACIVLIGFVVVGAMYWLALQGKNPTESDFIGYWAAGRQLAAHANPYDIPAALRLEQAEGYHGTEPRVTPSPPVALFLLWPFGFLSAKTSMFCWTMAMLASLAFSLRLLGLLIGQPRSMLLLLGFLFAPALACLEAGQLGLLFLLGITLFLFSIRTRPALAGAALLPLLLKPHLFLPFALALLLWILMRRAWAVLAGASAAALAGAALTLLLDPQVWTHYLHLLHAASLQNRYTPTLSVALRLLVAWNAEWPRFVLPAAGCLWAVWYVRSRRARWDWQLEGLVVLLVSVWCSPYTWFTDESVLLPALLVALLAPQRAGRSAWPTLAIASIPLLELSTSIDIKSWAYVWTPSAWLLCFLYATRKSNAASENPVAASMPS